MAAELGIHPVMQPERWPHPFDGTWDGRISHVLVTKITTTARLFAPGRKNLAYRDTCSDDGRGVYAVITERGEVPLREVRGVYEGRVRELPGNISVHFPGLDAYQLSGSP